MHEPNPVQQRGLAMLLNLASYVARMKNLVPVLCGPTCLSVCLVQEEENAALRQQLTAPPHTAQQPDKCARCAQLTADNLALRGHCSAMEAREREMLHCLRVSCTSYTATYDLGVTA